MINAPIKMTKDFEKTLFVLQEKYGEDFEILNGIHESQLNYSTFIDGFVDKKVADITIDSNANAANKDIRSLLSEKGKSHDKLFAFNKIFYEIKKKYNLTIAKEWLETEYNGGFYLHNAPTATYMPYCYKGEELLIIKYNGKELATTFSDLYHVLVDDEQQYDENNNSYCKYPNNLYVKDLVDNQEVWTKITKLCAHNNDKPMHFIKTANGLSICVTNDHPIISGVDEIPASEITTEDYETTHKINPFNNSLTEFNEITLTKDLGYLLGILLAEGNAQNYTLSLRQYPGKIQDKILTILQNYCMAYSIDENNTRIRILSSDIQKFLYQIMEGQTSQNKILPFGYIDFCDDFLQGIIAGVIDGDGTIDGYKNRHCTIRVASRALLNQLSLYLQTKNIFVGDLVPYIRNGNNSFTQKLPMYGIGFNLSQNEDFSLNIGSVKINDKYISKMRTGNFKNKKYDFNYGDVSIINNEITFDEKVVYDISTETGHFICNNTLVHNCYAYDLTRLATEGLFFLQNYNNEPPQHLTTFLDDVIEFISFMSNRSSGAVGIPNILIWTYYFWKKDCETQYYIKNPDYYIKQHFQKLIYRLNQPFMRIDQTAFVNVSIFDRNYIEALFGGMKYPDGTYVIDEVEGLIEHQKIFMEVVSEIRSENLFTFPVLTYSLLYKDKKFVDEEFARWCCDHNWKWNDSNFFNSDNVNTLSNCCRLLSETNKLDAFINSIGGTALSIGSVAVNTINLMKIAFESDLDEEKYLLLLKQRTTLCCKVLDVLRHIISRNVEKGLLPNYQPGGVELEKQYCTIGILGFFEAIELFGYIKEDEFGYEYYTEEGIKFGCKIFDILNEVKDSFTNIYSFNIESVPAERAAITLCQKDNLLYDLRDKFIYSNQWIPLSAHCTIQEKLKLSAIFDLKCSGGSIAHINIESNFPNKEVAWEMLNKVAQSGTIYSAFNTRINECKNHHGFVGANLCPICNEPVYDTYQRIVGYLVPTRNYSKDRFKEFTTREWYNYAEMQYE